MVHYTELVGTLNMHPESVRRYFTILSRNYPENLEYIRGMLILRKPFTAETLKPIKETLEEKLKKLDEIIEEAKRLLVESEKYLNQGEWNKFKQAFNKAISILESKQK
jgi:wyosine [tRNA(Phe)-imidazoG37] synthetase (radical SAM superfamily)